MKNILRFFIFFAVSLAILAPLAPVSKTKWADNVRAQVAAHRAAKRQKMEAAQVGAGPQKGEKAEDHEGGPRQEGQHAGQQRERNREQAGMREGTVNGKGKAEQHPGGAMKGGAPKPKPAELSWRAAQDIPKFLVQFGLPFLAVALITASVRRARLSKNRKHEEA